MEISFREYRMSDAADLAEKIDNPKIIANLRDGIPSPYSIADGEAFIQGVLDAPADSQYVRAITDGDRAIGCIGAYRGANIHSRTAEMGYHLAQEYWGRGITTQVVRDFCRSLFEQTDLLRIYAEPFAHNIASRRVLEKAGFTKEGVLRSHAVKNGEVIDMVLYSLLRGEL